MSLPEIIMANPLPMTMKPAALPLVLLANQAAVSAIIGTLAAPLPNPVAKYSTSTPAKPVAVLMSSMEPPTSSRAANISPRGPSFETIHPLASTATR